MKKHWLTNGSKSAVPRKYTPSKMDLYRAVGTSMPATDTEIVTILLVYGVICKKDVYASID